MQAARGAESAFFPDAAPAARLSGRFPGLNLPKNIY